ncbi:MAG: hypothetical protein U0T77_00125 [Chitinophagales bacterium]
MQKTIIPFLIALIAFNISSCKKATEDITPPSITITSPTEAEEIMQMTANDSSTVTAIITDEDLHAFSLLIAKPDGSDTLLYIPESHQEVNSLNISEKFKLPVVAGTVDYRITIHAEDHSENDSTAVRNFKIKNM